MLYSPTDEELREIKAKVASSTSDKTLHDNHLFSLFYDAEEGLYPRRAREPSRWEVRDGELVRLRRHMGDREWIERHVKIVDKAGNLVPFILNEAQRDLLSKIQRMERVGMPVRIIILKARQIGFSTLIQAWILSRIVRSSNKRAVLCTHKKDSSRAVLGKTHNMRKNLLRGASGKWELKMTSKSRYLIEWGDPIDGSIEVTSDEVDDPGHGDTAQFLHLSESALYKNTESTEKGLFQILAAQGAAFKESTAKGLNSFHDDFMAAWAEKDKPLRDRVSGWLALFYGWWQHDEYRYTRTVAVGRALPDALREEISHSLSEEELWLLEQGVDYDQLAWRRWKITTDFKGNLELFNEQFPSRPELAFLATGRLAFERDTLLEMQRDAPASVWTGELQDTNPPTLVVDRGLLDE